MRRSRHRLDLLPLLDVFMVVLFVFATIQEQKLDEATRALKSLEQEPQAVANADEAAVLRERVRELEDTLVEMRASAQATLAGLAAGDDAVRRQNVLVKLLDRYSVFELEIAGATDENGAVINRCCYRTDPLSATWTSCGEIPAVAQARETWWQEGGGGLDAALRRTKGGNAMTIVRQDERASYRIAARVEELLRDHFADQQIYDEGVSLVEIHCGTARETMR